MSKMGADRIQAPDITFCQRHTFVTFVLSIVSFVLIFIVLNACEIL